MKTRRKILIQMANPAGNKTAFVLNGARPSEYSGIARSILEDGEHDAEQVGFVKGTDSFDMAGMEFCGNASRAFALISAKGMIDGNCSDEEPVTMQVTVSDSEKPVTCQVRPSDDYAGISMPLPKRVKTLTHCDFDPAEGHDVIIMDGIAHIVMDDVEYTEENFQMIKDAVMTQFDPQAMGVMYLDRESMSLTPVVYVKDIGSTYIEGSCCSGSTAAVYTLSKGLDDGEYSYELTQPRGVINAKVTVKDGSVTDIYIDGPVEISEPELIDLEFETDEDERTEMADTW